MALSHTLTPLSDAVAEDLRRKVINHWNAIAQSDDLGGPLGELVRETEVKVTELLQTGQICDIYVANRITAEFEYRRQALS
jgi:hypothetical protein